jgi:hypothetical protein
MEKVIFIQINQELGINYKIGEDLIPEGKMSWKFIKPTNIGIGKIEDVLTKPPINETLEYYRIGETNIFAYVIKPLTAPRTAL